MNKLKFIWEGAWGLKQVWELLHPLLSWSSGNDSGKQIQRLAVQILVRWVQDRKKKVKPAAN